MQAAQRKNANALSVTESSLARREFDENSAYSVKAAARQKDTASPKRDDHKEYAAQYMKAAARQRDSTSLKFDDHKEYAAQYIRAARRKITNASTDSQLPLTQAESNVYGQS